MKVQCLAPAELPADLRDRWLGHLEGNPELRSPYFRPEFTEAIGRARADTFVAVVDDGEAFLPFHREAFNAGVGRPVGAYIADYQGVISAPGYAIDPVALVRRMGLQAWEFKFVPATQTAFERFASDRPESVLVDVTTWKSREKELDRERRYRRKLGRDIGPLELEWDCKDSEVFHQLMAWKSEQYARTGMKDSTQDAWMMQALNDIRACQDPMFAGLLTVLRAGGRVVASHFGMLSGPVLHGWFPAYDPELADHRPGQSFWLSLLDEAAERGVELLDLGTGDAPYKARLKTSTLPLLGGVVAANPWIGSLRQMRKSASLLVQKTPLRGPAAAVLNRLRGQRR
jgi:CelD/BcsL family acetyltransferase involved in cellulose biosynthesis